MIKNTWYDYSSNSIIAGITTRHFPFNRGNDRSEFAKLLGLNHQNLVVPKQVHSGSVTICNNSGKIPNTDGLITNKKELVLSLQVADCIPIFIIDKKKFNLGLIHAGWRGINLKIVENSIAKIQELDSLPNELNIILGSSIRQCCFQVGKKVAKLFRKQFQTVKNDDTVFLNLQEVVIEKLIFLGIPRRNIIDKNQCTCCSDDFYSYRREGKKAGRMVAMIGSKYNNNKIISK